MAGITLAQIQAEIQTQMPDNHVNQISPAIQRSVLTDMTNFTYQYANAYSVAAQNPAVVPDGTDQSVNLNAIISTASIAGALTNTAQVLQFNAGIYIFNSSIVLRPWVILRGLGIDVTVLKDGVDNIELITRWGAVGANAGTSAVELMTVWGYGDRNLVQNTSPLVSIGPFNLYWVRQVKAIYSNNMSIKGIGGIGIVDSCIVTQGLRDGINLTGTDYVEITNNDITMVGDDAIAYHLANGTTGVNDNSCRITGNRISKSGGIKALGARNSVIANNVLRFYTNYGVFVGIDNSFQEGEITRFSVAITGNSMLDGLNGNNFGGGSVGYGIFLTGGMSLGSGGPAIPVNVGQYLSGPKKIQTPDAFINTAGPTQPKGPDGNISITGNTIRQTVATPGMTHFSDAGFGMLWGNTGPANPAITTLLGNVAGIGIHTDLENCTVTGNTLHGVGNGVEATAYLHNIVIEANTIFRLTGNGISLIAPSLNQGSIAIERNLIDMDPYLESPSRTSPIDGSWVANDGSSSMGVWTQNYNGVSVRNNRFRNCIRAIKSPSGNYITEKNIIEFDWTSANAGAGNSGISTISGIDPSVDIAWFCNSDPRSASFNQFDLNFTLSSSAMPAAGTWYRGTFVRNNNPLIDGNNLIIWGWIRLTSNSNNVLGTDWAVARVKQTSP